MKRRPRLYFSFRSPYSWLTLRRLCAAVPDAPAQFEWFPYWDPDEITSAALAARNAEFHYVQMSRAKHFYLLMDTRRLAEREGLSMAWPIDVDPWWELPHLAYLAARRQGRELAFYDAIVAARWSRGEDVCTEPVVRAAAEESGCDPDVLAAAPADDSIRAEAADCLVAAYNDDIFGIPYLRWGRHRFWGYDRLDGFLRLWEAEHGPDSELGAVTEPRTDVDAGHGVDTAQEGAELAFAGFDARPGGAPRYDTDTAGGCG